MMEHLQNKRSIEKTKEIITYVHIAMLNDLLQRLKLSQVDTDGIVVITALSGTSISFYLSKLLMFRSMIELEKIRPKSKLAKYFFADDDVGTLFRAHLKPLNELFAFTSAGVKPLLDEMKWQDCIE